MRARSDKRLCMLCLVLLALSIVLTAVWAVQRATRLDRLSESEYTVQNGDSLWTVAAKCAPDSYGTWEYIDLIREINGLDTYTIYPGQRLTVLR